MQVRCMAEDDQNKDVTPITTPPPASQPTPFPPPKPKVSTKFSDVLAFSGPAPERINGRLAMIGFVAAMAVELSKGEDVLAQISNMVCGDKHCANPSIFDTSIQRGECGVSFRGDYEL
ncbi:hypothetical protein QW71_36460 [Paenibacillus sp. IHB B 3415]|nr:hypothetical protein QW71_36460 [Paenibacillus sp. IHB B 3415]